MPPVLSAARGGYVEVVRCLLDAGVDINHRDHHGFTALHGVRRESPADVASLLLRRNADVTAVTVAGGTALSVATHNGCDGFVRVLLAHGGSEVDAVDNGGEPALHLACVTGHADCVGHLLDAGADATLRDVHGRTAVDLAATMAGIPVSGSSRDMHSAGVAQRAVSSHRHLVLNPAGVESSVHAAEGPQPPRRGINIGDGYVAAAELVSGMRDAAVTDTYNSVREERREIAAVSGFGVRVQWRCSCCTCARRALDQQSEGG